MTNVTSMKWLRRLFGGSQEETDDRRTGSDRRSGDDRRSSLGAPPINEERRSGADRRSGDDRRNG
jgi:hypothetical protein